MVKRLRGYSALNSRCVTLAGLNIIICLCSVYDSEDTLYYLWQGLPLFEKATYFHVKPRSVIEQPLVGPGARGCSLRAHCLRAPQLASVPRTALFIPAKYNLDVLTQSRQLCPAEWYSRTLPSATRTRSSLCLTSTFVSAPNL